MMNKRPKTVGRGKGPKSNLTTADLVVLSLLAEQPMHGYQLMSEYARQEVADWASVSKAQIYYALEKLARRGLLEVQRQDRPENSVRERTVYAPTRAGKLALAESLAATAWATTRVATPFTTWVGLSIHTRPSAALAVIAERRAFLREELRRENASLTYIKSLSSARARVGEAIVDLVIRQLKVELKWIDELAVRLKSTADAN